MAILVAVDIDVQTASPSLALRIDIGIILYEGMTMKKMSILRTSRSSSQV